MDLISKLRLQQVKRFPICHTNRDQSVAEHSYGVLQITKKLIEGMDREFAMECLIYALDHDLEEVYTGDIPSSFKRELRAKCPEVSPLLDGEGFAPDDVKSTVKLADYLEAIYWIREFGGSRLAHVVLHDIIANFENACQTSKAPQQIVMRAQSILGQIL